MRHYSELSPLEKKAREASGRLKCTDCPIYKLCKTSEMFIDACDYIFLKAFKAGYNRRKKEMRLKKGNDMFCKCNQSRKYYPLKDWRVIRYQYTPHGYSRVKCLKCGCVWITRANYVEQTPNKDGQKRLFDYEKSNIERQQRK